MKERYEATGEQLQQLFPEVVRDYFLLTPYTNRPDLFDQQTETQKIYSEQADAWQEETKMTIWSQARDGHYSQAVSNMDEAFHKIGHQNFTAHDARAIEIFFLRRLGKIYEHWSTYGTKKLTMTDEEIGTHYIEACYFYMLSDIELGVMTEFSGRASESLRGAGFHEFASRFDKAFWGENIIYVSPEDEIDLSLLKSRGQKTDNEQSGATSVEIWNVEPPPDGNEN